MIVDINFEKFDNLIIVWEQNVSNDKLMLIIVLCKFDNLMIVGVKYFVLLSWFNDGWWTIIRESI